MKVFIVNVARSNLSHCGEMPSRTLSGSLYELYAALNIDHQWYCRACMSELRWLGHLPKDNILGTLDVFSNHLLNTHH